MLSKKLNQLCWCLLCRTETEKDERREAPSADLEKKELLMDGWWERWSHTIWLRGSSVTGYWPFSCGFLFALSRRNPPITHCSQQLGSATWIAHSMQNTITRQSIQTWPLWCTQTARVLQSHSAHIHSQYWEKPLQSVNCSCTVRLVTACVRSVCGMCESILIVFVHMYFRLLLYHFFPHSFQKEMRSLMFCWILNPSQP